MVGLWCDDRLNANYDRQHYYIGVEFGDCGHEIGLWAEMRRNLPLKHIQRGANGLVHV